MKKTLLFCDLKRIFFNEPCRDYGHALIQIAPAKVMTCGEHGPMGRSIVSNVLSVIAVARYLKLPFVMNAMSLICLLWIKMGLYSNVMWVYVMIFIRSEEHTSELQSRGHLVCRLLLEKENELR